MRATFVDAAAPVGHPSLAETAMVPQCQRWAVLAAIRRAPPALFSEIPPGTCFVTTPRVAPAAAFPQGFFRYAYFSLPNLPPTFLPTPSTPSSRHAPLPLSHNAAIYGVEDRIEFILGDAMKVLPTLKADAVFLSPPWGGPGYQGSKTFDLDSMIPPPLSALEMFRAAREVTPNVVFFLPRNVDPYQVARLPAAAAALPRGAGAGIAEEDQRGVDLLAIDDTCELEKHFLNGKLKTTTAYFGEDIAISSGNNAAAAAEVGRDSDHGHGPVGTIEGAAAEAPAEVGSSLVGVAAKNSSELYGDNNWREAAAWSGRHVRFSEEDDGEGGEEGGDVVEVRNDSSNGGQERENALYEAWMAT